MKDRCRIDIGSMWDRCRINVGPRPCKSIGIKTDQLLEWSFYQCIAIHLSMHIVTHQSTQNNWFANLDPCKPSLCYSINASHNTLLIWRKYYFGKIAGIFRYCNKWGPLIAQPAHLFTNIELYWEYHIYSIRIDSCLQILQVRITMIS